MIPILMITYNRLEFTKKALAALCNCRNASIYVIDNGSSDGTKEWLATIPCKPMSLTINKTNTGIAGAMNQFLEMTKDFQYVAKVDNDTIVFPDFLERMIPHMVAADIVQAKHPILKQTHPGGFDEWVKTMRRRGALRINHFVGGSGILFKRHIIDRIPKTDWMLGGWRQWQRENRFVIKAFATDVEVQLLDTDENGAQYQDYPNYYKETGRTC
jgi:glycosyltransferase involved in cell wall biosynthesis